MSSDLSCFVTIMILLHQMSGSNVTNMTSSSSLLTVVNLLNVVTPTAMDNSSVPATRQSRTSMNALMYIVVVLFFYSFSLIILMVKYIRREKEEADLRHYYYEFVSRDRFQSALFQNKVFMEGLLKKERDKCKTVRDKNDNNVVCNRVSLQDEELVVEKLLQSNRETLV